ncbi:1-aminocyclopropane-1-carboxylate oxidase-like protein 2 [Forsythia ovata]|uniref:1-aminocyclopropane-1-carboxylate oxidase-like protein 2 n=1 Tax=Forsythia ovata TaxID=205694 RepID=A0ABD1PJU0_9LAMI
MAEIIDASGAQDYDRMQDLKDFDKTEAGVKGLVDTGLQKIPKIFVKPAEELAEDLKHKRAQIEVPVIDLGGLKKADRRKQIVEEGLHQKHGDFSRWSIMGYP